MKSYKNIKRLVAANKLDEAMDKIIEEEWNISKDQFNEAILLKMAYNQIIQQENQSLVTREEAQTMMLKLARNFLKFLDRINIRGS